MGLFGANMADFQLGLALDDKAGGYLETDEEIAQARSPRFEVLRCLPFIGMHRLRERRRGVVSFSNLRPFGPRHDVVAVTASTRGRTRVHASREMTLSINAGRRPPRGHQGRLDYEWRGH